MQGGRLWRCLCAAAEMKPQGGDVANLATKKWIQGAFTRDARGMFLSQKKYAIELLERAHMSNCNATRTPEPHLAALKWVLCYVCGTLDFRLQLYASLTSSLVAYSDADWAGCLTTRQSTSGRLHMCSFGDNLSFLYGHLKQATYAFLYVDIFTKGLPSSLFEEFRTNLSRDEMKELEILIVCDTGIKEFSQEIGELVNLSRLDATNCKNLSRVVPGVISKLWRLAELCIGFMSVEVVVASIETPVTEVSSSEHGLKEVSSGEAHVLEVFSSIPALEEDRHAHPGLHDPYVDLLSKEASPLMLVYMLKEVFLSLFSNVRMLSSEAQLALMFCVHHSQSNY
ncbi:ribonuclease H-like domain-containing protein [Tanacetum coccineum]